VAAKLTPRARGALYVIPAWTAFVFLLAMFGLYALDMPYYDQWELVPLLEKLHDGTLRPGDLWAQHNEHRLIFPRLLMLLMAQWSDWNIYWELAANLALAILSWGVLLVLIRRSSAPVHEEENGPVYMVMTLIVFSVSQWQNWFFGWQLQEFMNVLAVLVTLGCLTWRQHTTLGVALAMGSAVVATYSFANGILIWPIGVLVLALQRTMRRKCIRVEMAAWVLAGIMVAASYLYGYETPSYHPPLMEALSQPLQCLLYLLVYLGQPLGNYNVILAACMGGLGLLVWSVTLFQLVASRVPTTATLPWMGMALYAIGTASITALGRVDEGLAQALSSRYVTMANLLWIALVVQVYWVAQVSDGRLIRRLLPLKIAFVCLALFAASAVGAYRWTERYNAYSAVRTELLHGDDAEALRILYPPRPRVILQRREFLRRHGLGIFGDSEHRPQGEWEDPDQVAREDQPGHE